MNTISIKAHIEKVLDALINLVQTKKFIYECGEQPILEAIKKIVD
jgi:hypothetical protein